MLKSSKNSDKRRLFFGCETAAPWPSSMPEGRIIEEANRHVTLLFLGQASLSSLEKLLFKLPLPDFAFAPVGIFEECLFLPKRKPRLAAWKISFLEKQGELASYRSALAGWLRERGFEPDLRYKEFLPHLSLCRGSFSKEEWKRAFVPLPLLLKNFALFESLGNSLYRSLWSHSFTPPFEEIEHTADVAYLVRGEDLKELQLHALFALAFLSPPFLNYLGELPDPEDSDQMIANLNEIVAKVDTSIGSPLKAVSYHGVPQEISKNQLEWEMIIDV